MHPNPAFRGTPREKNIAFARERGFGTLAVNSGDGPLLSHVPFLLDEDGETADLHLVRSNPIARLTGAQSAVISITGGDAYVSPDWYEQADQVPTWNYVAVHLRGMLEPLPHEEMRAMLDRQSAGYETRLPKPPWTTSKMTPNVLERMMRQILPFRFRINAIDGTWKLNQNKPADARLSAADHVAESALGSDTGQLAALMRSPPET